MRDEALTPAQLDSPELKVAAPAGPYPALTRPETAGHGRSAARTARICMQPSLVAFAVHISNGGSPAILRRLIWPSCCASVT